jgi:hypothetical protein
MTRLRSKRRLFSARPFEGNGTSLYATIGDGVQYRRLRIVNQSCIKPITINKTTRVAFVEDPDKEIVWTVPAEMLGETVTFDLRRFADDVEAVNDNYQTRTVAIDGDGEDETGILGTAYLLSTELLTEGRVKVDFVYTASTSGVQPQRFELRRTAGPTSPAAAIALYAGSSGAYSITSSSLLDTSAYTFKITAVNGSIEADLITGIIITADASGPPAPTVTVEVI